MNINIDTSQLEFRVNFISAYNWWSQKDTACLHLTFMNVKVVTKVCVMEASLLEYKYQYNVNYFHITSKSIAIFNIEMRNA